MLLYTNNGLLWGTVMFSTGNYEPLAHNYGLLYTNGLLWGIVASCFQLLGCPGRLFAGHLPNGFDMLCVFGKVRASRGKGRGSAFQALSETTFNYQNHHCCKLPAISISIYIFTYTYANIELYNKNLYKHDGFGSQRYNVFDR